MKYYAQVELKAAYNAGLIDVLDATDAAYIGDKYYTKQIYIVDRDVYEKAGYDHGKFVKIAGRPVRDKYVFAF
ncbi:hypothetical protein PO148_08420 [Limosilactobacillus mucosae]|uniref:Uncharacterized protein n=1 Tax=Limosilactobacillus mucosae TaxID=97478 RepID=A0AAJ1M993_LIMMU|nr:hypothetical protein [Limosilactobacillus mucosae]MDC2827669.1 hypothetical protein [Limosilactobacillus mucosae]MDC2830414.1 hypothetical protein [Limosilactobacillus mucosae]MDC2835336.1 hypothetical protein [Limosilactobacillus mucosae]MDC2837988.1 hypothetical protein [Limosilactobacillus mucosae]MDC2850001.1 hypothetical protein [Limosilactobacillus mucosae]